MIVQGTNAIKSALVNIPMLPGIYRMLDADNRVIYIGKAKLLKKRVTSYTKSDLVGKVKRMVSLACSVEFTVTASEAEALLLEATLIKKIQPKFNILLKDDKSFPYIKLREDHDFPQVIKYRGKIQGQDKIFGPFASATQVNITLTELLKIFKLRSCTDSYFSTRQRPCLQYQINRCYAPCTGKISKEDYKDLVQQVIEFLSGKSQELQKNLARRMEKLSDDMRYEEAAEIRDRIKSLSYVQLRSGTVDIGVSDIDVIAIASKDNMYCIEVYVYRTGQFYGNKAYFPVHTEGSEKNEILRSFLGQYYQSRKTPAEILINHEIEEQNVIEEALKKLHEVKVKIVVPQRGNKLKLIKNALESANTALEQNLKNSSKNETMLQEVQDLFVLEECPTRIEIYDNSHIMGTHAVGAMVVATNKGFDKGEYRTFNIKMISNGKGGDDYSMLREVLNRRLIRLLKEPDKKPGLMIIDGGKGHMGIVEQVMKDHDIRIPYVCMSKGPFRDAGLEQFHMPHKETFTLDKNLAVMKYLQILRDEAHNFAIRRHRDRRSRAMKVSSLNDIPDIGEIRKKALLNYFGSYGAICAATVYELTKVSGISKQLARKIYNYTKMN